MVGTETEKRVAKNTLILYGRQLLLLAINLYAVRVALNILGAEDYGIYNVVAGIVALGSFLSTTMASATQRFFSFALGQRDEQKLLRIFSVNSAIYAGIAVVSVVGLETIGLIFIKNQINIPSTRLPAALWVFQYSVLMFVASIVSTLYIAIIIAHENMRVYAFVSLFEALLKLGAVLALSNVPWDKLQAYGFLMLLVSLLTASAYLVACSRLYSQYRYQNFKWDAHLFREILRFTGWTLFGQFSTVTRTQAVTILLNQSFNPVVVASRAIAVNVATQVNIFASNFNVGLYPAIVKAFAAKNLDEMHSLITGGSKATFFLTWILTLPMLIEMTAVLTLWLGNPPPDAVLFTRLALIEAVIMVIALPIGTAARAAGDMKRYELILGSIQIGIFLLSWLVLTTGGPAYSVFIVAIVLSMIVFIVRLLIVQSLIVLSLRRYWYEVLIPLSQVVVASTALALSLRVALPQGLLSTICVVVSSALSVCVAMYFLGLNAPERLRAKSFALKRLRRRA